MTVTNPAPATKPSFWAGRWYFVITIFSAGLLAWVPFMHARSRLHSRRPLVLTAIYASVAVLEVVLLSWPVPDGQDLTGGRETIAVIAGLLPLAIVAVACVQQASLRREVYSAKSAPSATEPALAAALAARSRRDTARLLATTDPLVARDLRIGRPDLPRSYDDGGLVDFNSAPAALIAQTCGVTAEAAGSIVSARSACGGFLTVDDVFTLTEIPVNTWDVIRDRGVVLPMLT